MKDGESLRGGHATTFGVMMKYDVLRVGAAGAVTLMLLTAVPALAATGEWISDGKAKVRLVAEGVDTAGRLRAGLEIALDPGWHTYWRSPGDSGVAPVIDFSGSRNVGPVETAFPVPERLDDGY